MEIIVISIVFSILTVMISEGYELLDFLKNDMDSFIDLMMAVDFMRDEVMYNIRSEGFTASMTNYITFEGYSGGRVRTITYRIVERDGEYALYRHADGEGNNVLIRSKEKMWFEIREKAVGLHVGDLVFYIAERDEPIRGRLKIEVTGTLDGDD